MARHMEIDPFGGTRRVQELKAKLHRKKYGTEIPEEIDLTFGISEWEQDGFQIEAKVVDDDHGMSMDDDEALGEFSEYPPDLIPGEYIKIGPSGSEKFDLDRAGILNAYSYGPFEGYWNNASSGTVRETRNYASKRGMSKQLAEEWARATQRMFFERALKTIAGEITNVGVVVTASRAGVVLGRSSLWGIESDAGDYLNEVAAECASDAIDEANKEIDNLIRAAARIGA